MRALLEKNHQKWTKNEKKQILKLWCFAFKVKTVIEVCSPHLYASFGTFNAKIGQSFEAQWVFEEGLKIDKKMSSKEKLVDFGILPNV